MLYIFFNEVKLLSRAISYTQSLLSICINFFYVFKLVSDIYLLKEFRNRYLENYLQARDLKEEYWDYSQEPHVPVLKEYLLRYTLTNIFLVKCGNSFLIILFPLMMLYNSRFHPFMSNFISRFFFVMRELAILVASFSFLAFFLLFAYNSI